jgi:hypothetical protein
MPNQNLVDWVVWVDWVFTLGKIGNIAIRGVYHIDEKVYSIGYHSKYRANSNRRNTLSYNDLRLQPI